MRTASTFFLVLLPMVPAACGDVVTDPAGDATETDAVHDVIDAAGDPDAADVDAEMDGTDPMDALDGSDPLDAQDEDATDASADPDSEATDVPDLVTCGNGMVDVGEDCDDASDFCSGCVFADPAGWTRCTSSSGETVFLHVESWAGNRSAMQYRWRCRNVVDGMGPPDTATYWGLAVILDEDVWDCLTPLLGTDEYYIGLFQDAAGPEPDGGWYWEGWDGTDWTRIADWDPDNGFLAAGMDDTGGGTNVGCGRLQQGGGGAWVFQDYSCGASEPWDGVCGVVYP